MKSDLRTPEMSFCIYRNVILRKMLFFYPKFGLFAHKMGQNGVHGGVYRVNFGFLRVPDPSEPEIMQTNFLKKIWPTLVQKDFEFFWAWAQKIDQNRPKWAQ